MLEVHFNESSIFPVNITINSLFQLYNENISVISRPICNILSAQCWQLVVFDQFSSLNAVSERSIEVVTLSSSTRVCQKPLIKPQCWFVTNTAGNPTHTFCTPVEKWWAAYKLRHRRPTEYGPREAMNSRYRSSGPCMIVKFDSGICIGNQWELPLRMLSYDLCFRRIMVFTLLKNAPPWLRMLLWSWEKYVAIIWRICSLKWAFKCVYSTAVRSDGIAYVNAVYPYQFPRQK